MDQFVAKYMPSIQKINGDSGMIDTSLLQFLTRGGLHANAVPATQPAENPFVTSASTLEKVEGMIASIEGESPPSQNGTHSLPTTVGDATNLQILTPLTVFPPSRLLNHPLQSTRSAFTPVSRRAPSSPIVLYQSTTVERPPPSETPAPYGFEDRYIKKEELSSPGDTPGPSYQFSPSGQDKQPPFPALVMATQGHHFPPPSPRAKSNHAKYKKSRRDTQAHLLRLPPSHSTNTMSLQSGDSLDDQAHPPVLTSPNVKDHPNVAEDIGSTLNAPEDQSLIPPSPSTSNPPPHLDGPYSREGDGPLKIRIMLNPAHSFNNPSTSSRGRPPKERPPSSSPSPTTTATVIAPVQKPQQHGSTTSDEVPLEDASAPSTNRRSPPPRHPGPPPLIGRLDPYLFHPLNGRYVPPSPPYLSKHHPPILCGGIICGNCPPAPPSSTNDNPSAGAEQPQSRESTTSEKTAEETASVPLNDGSLPPPPPASNLPATSTSSRHPQPIKKYPVCPPPPPPPRTLTSTTTKQSSGIIGDSHQPVPSGSTRSAEVKIEEAPLPSGVLPGRHPNHSVFPLYPPPPPPPLGFCFTNNKPSTGIMGASQQSESSGSSGSDKVPSDDASLTASTLPNRCLPSPPPNATPIHPSLLLRPPLPPSFISTNNKSSSGVNEAAPQSQSIGLTTSDKAPKESAPVVTLCPPSAFHQVSPNFNPRDPLFIYPPAPPPTPSNNPWFLPRSITPSFTNNGFFPGALGAGQHPQPWPQHPSTAAPGDPIPVITHPPVQGFKDAVGRSNGLAILDPDQNLIIEGEQGRKWTISSNFLVVALNEAISRNPEGGRQLFRRAENLTRAKKRLEKEKEKKAATSTSALEGPPQSRCTSVPPPSTFFNRHHFNFRPFPQATGVSQGLVTGYGHNQNSAFMVNPMAHSLGAPSTSTQHDHSPFTFKYNREEEEAERKKELNELKRKGNTNGKESSNKKKK